MADEAGTMQNSGRSANQVLWLALAALCCVLVLACAAFAMVYLLTKQGASTPAIDNHQTFNIGGAAGAAPAAVDAATRPDSGILSRPHNTSAPTGSRMTAPMGKGQGPIPVDHDPRSAARESAPTRSENQPPPYAGGSTPSRSGGMFMRVRAQGAAPQGITGPMPFRVRQFKVGQDGRVDGVAAGYPALGQETEYSYLPDVHFRPSASQSLNLSVEVLNPRLTSQIDGLRSPKSFQFFVADLRVTNLATDEAKLEVDMFEVRDRDKVAYLANPEMMTQGFAPVLPPSGQATFMAAYLVPVDSPLDALVTLEGGGAILTAPLQAP